MLQYDLTQERLSLTIVLTNRISIIYFRLVFFATVALSDARQMNTQSQASITKMSYIKLALSSD